MNNARPRVSNKTPKKLRTPMCRFTWLEKTKRTLYVKSYSIILDICQRRVVLHFQVQGQPQLYNKNFGVFHKVLQDKTAPKGQSIVGSVPFEMCWE